MARRQKYAQGLYEVKNINKYVGKGKPKYRSGWELTFMIFCDTNDKIISWASESMAIPYRHPVTGKQHKYIPDFFIVYQDKLGKVKAEIIEIKPKKQTIPPKKPSRKTKKYVKEVTTYITNTNKAERLPFMLPSMVV